MGMPTPLVRHVARQLLLGLDYLHMYVWVGVWRGGGGACPPCWCATWHAGHDVLGGEIEKRYLHKRWWWCVCGGGRGGAWGEGRLSDGMEEGRGWMPRSSWPSVSHGSGP